MSRSNKGAKGPGWDRWTREANSQGKTYQSPGRWAKNQLARKLRRSKRNINE